MSPEKELQLVSFYPKLFEYEGGSEPFKMFGFECGDGWYDLLKECILAIKLICERDGWDVRVDQIKEKYGTLRFYTSIETREIGAAIEVAEKKSLITCEACGNPGSLRGSGWYYVECDACEAKRGMPSTCIITNDACVPALLQCEAQK